MSDAFLIILVIACVAASLAISALIDRKPRRALLLFAGCALALAAGALLLHSWNRAVIRVNEMSQPSPAPTSH